MRCEYCGQLLEEGAKYCSYCGAPVPAQESAQQTTGSYSSATVEQGAGVYNVVLVSLGTCARAAATDLLEDLLGYDNAQAAQLISLIPCEVAQKLTWKQAKYVAKAMTEYGMQVSVSDRNGYVDLDDDDDGYVFDSDGVLLGSVAAVLGTIGVMNRITAPRPWSLGGWLNHLFVPRRPRPEPPRHRRREIPFRGGPADDRPPMRRDPGPAPAMHRAVNPAPARGPQPGSRGAGMPGGGAPGAGSSRPGSRGAGMSGGGAPGAGSSRPGGRGGAGGMGGNASGGRGRAGGPGGPGGAPGGRRGGPGGPGGRR